MARPCSATDFNPTKSKDVVGSFRQKIADGLHRRRLCGVDDVGGTEAPGLIESLLLDIDDDDPRRAREARAANRIESHAASAEDHDRLAGADVGGVQDGTGARHNAAAEQRCLGERKLLGHDGELVLVNEGLFGEAAQPEALEQAGPISGQAR